MKHVFLTGATGNVGGRILTEFLSDRNYRVTALVRAPSRAAALQRLAPVLSFWEAAPPGDRLDVVPGDIERPGLGLDAEARKRLVDSITHIVHCAANIKLNLSVAEARQLIVEGTRQVLSVAKPAHTSGRLQRFVFVSTMEVAGDYDGIVYEEFLDRYPRNFLNTYEIAKAEAESVIRDEIAGGLPAVVVRPSMVVGESTSGKALGYQSFYYFLDDMLLKPKGPILPRGCNVETCPVDILATVVKLAGEDAETVGKVFQVTQSYHDYVSFENLIDQLSDQAERVLGTRPKRPVYVAPKYIWWLLSGLSRVTFGKVRQQIENQKLFLAFTFLNFRFDNTNTVALLERHGKHFPRFSEYFSALVERYLQEARRTKKRPTLA